MNIAILRRFFLCSAIALGATFLSHCSSVEVATDYDAPAYRPTNPNNVHVKVSLNNRMCYVMEGDRPLLVTPVAIGKAGHETPRGNFTCYKKIEKKRSNTYGYHVSGSTIRPGKSSNTPRGSRYVGYPMPYWVEFKSAYGFHAGSVWPTPRSHGCLRLHANVAPKFFALVNSSTSVNISYTQPEDATLGENVRRPADYADPDPPTSVMTSSAAFPPPNGPLFEG